MKKIKQRQTREGEASKVEFQSKELSYSSQSEDEEQVAYSDQEMIDREEGEYLDDLDKDERLQI